MLDQLKQLESELHSIRGMEHLSNLERVFSNFDRLLLENQEHNPGLIHYGLFEEMWKTEHDLKMARKHRTAKKGMERFNVALGHIKDDIKYVLDGIKNQGS